MVGNLPVIALDAGHGFHTSGKRVTLKGYPDTREWWMNDRIIDIVENEIIFMHKDIQTHPIVSVVLENLNSLMIITSDGIKKVL